MNTILQQINALLPDNHTEEISEADVRASFRHTLTGVQKWLNELTLGGRNLLLGTRDMSGNISATNTNTNEFFQGLKVAKTRAKITDPYLDVCTFITNEIPHGEYFTVSFWAKSDAPIQTHCFFYSPNNTLHSQSSTGHIHNSPDGLSIVNITTQWEKYWVTWRQSTTTSKKRIIIGRNFSKTSHLYIAGVKLEAGKNATDWTPAPEDIENKIMNLFKNLPDATHDPTYNKTLVVKPDGSLGTINRK